MGDINASINSTLEHSEDTGASGGAGKADIKESTEWAGSLSLNTTCHIVITSKYSQNCNHSTWINTKNGQEMNSGKQQPQRGTQHRQG